MLFLQFFLMICLLSLMMKTFFFNAIAFCLDLSDCCHFLMKAWSFLKMACVVTYLFAVTCQWSRNTATNCFLWLCSCKIVFQIFVGKVGFVYKEVHDFRLNIHTHNSISKNYVEHAILWQVWTKKLCCTYFSPIFFLSLWCCLSQHSPQRVWTKYEQAFGLYWTFLKKNKMFMQKVFQEYTIPYYCV